MDSRTPANRRHLVAVWFADIVGFSHLASANEDDAVRLVEAFQACVAQEVARYGGRVVKYIGDGAMAEFHSTDFAARAACALADSFAGRTGGQLRIGLHVGDVVVGDDEDLLGDGVNLAARLQAEAEPGEVVASEDAWRQLRQRKDFQFEEVGRRRLRGQAESVRIFRLCVVEQGLAAAEIRGGGPGPSSVAGSGGGIALFNRRYGIRHPRLVATALAVGLTGLLGISVGGGGAWLAGLARYPATAIVPADSGITSLPDFDPARIAVLYFDDHSPNGQLAYLANNLTEALIHELTQVSALSVVSRNGVKPFKDGDVPLDSIARALRVGSIVEGSVAESGGRVRVTVQLVDAASGVPLRSSVMEQPNTDVFALQDSVVSMVGTVLRQELGREIRLREIERSTDSREAYDLFMHAGMAEEEFSRLRSSDSEAAARALMRADSLLARAEALDSGWVEPIVRRGWYMRDLSMVEGPLPGRLDDEWSRRALAHAERAVQRGGAAAYELRGVLRFGLGMNAEGAGRDRLLRQAEADLRRAVALDPRRAMAWIKLSDLLVRGGRFAEAVFAAEQGLAADAFLADAEDTLFQIYYTGLQIGPTEEARRACEEGRRRFPNSDEFVSCKLFILASFPQVSPDLNRARALADTLEAVAPHDGRERFRAYGLMLAAQVAARAGLRDSAEALIQRAYGDSVFNWLAYNEAHARLLLGQQEQAIQLLSRSLTEDPDTAFLARDWWFADLRHHPGFVTLLGRYAEDAAGAGVTP